MKVKLETHRGLCNYVKIKQNNPKRGIHGLSYKITFVLFTLNACLV